MKRSIAFIVIGIVLSSLSCKKDDPSGPVGGNSGDNPDLTSRGFFVMNEGAFNSNNGSVSFFNYSKQSFSHSIFSNANDGKRLGDVVQSMAIYRDKGYIVVNNSEKIVGVNITGFSEFAQISGLKSPRFMQIVDSTKAYVTSFSLNNSSNPIKIIDLQTNQVVGGIDVNGWTERMLIVGNKTYVGNMTTDQILVIDNSNDNVVKEISVGVEPNSLVLGSNGLVYVLCSGGFDEEEPGIYVIDPQINDVVTIISGFKVENYPSNLVSANSGDSLYFMMNGVYKVSASDVTIPTEPFINTDFMTYPYGLFVDKTGSNIFISDAHDFTGNGFVYRFTDTGVLTDDYEVGIAPSLMIEF